MKRSQLLTHHPPHRQQWLDDRRQSWKTLDQVTDTDLITDRADDTEAIKTEVMKRRASSSAALLDRFRQAQYDGDLPGHVEPEALARFLFTILQGMVVQAGRGASREDLEGVLKISLMI